MSSEQNSQSIDEVIFNIRHTAERRRKNAGMDGSWGDGGASRLLEQVHFYEMGRKGMIPPEWREFTQEVQDDRRVFEALKRKHGW